MEKLTEQDGNSLDIVNENLETLKAIFPEAFTEGMVDFDVLRQLMGDAIEEGEEKYGLNWHGKKKARQIALTPSAGTLRPCKEESVDWESTRNIFIEGDNLEVLKLLQKSYAGKVKMIYIDPPYNTGNEFIYPDRFQDNLDTYLKYTGQKSDEGFKTTSNTESSGRYHTNWMNMIYPRLKVARNLLKNDGVIFISIDDTEQANLKKICDDVMGEENFVANIIWKKKYAPQNDAKYFSASHDHILCYAKHLGDFTITPLPRSEEMNNRYKNPDNDLRGDWKPENLTRQEFRPNDVYIVANPKNGLTFEPKPGTSWRRTEKRMNELIADNRIWFGPDGTAFPSEKRFLSEVKQGVTPQTIWDRSEVGDTQEGKKIIKDLLGNVSIFETAKPPRLIERQMQVSGVSNGDIVLDFFAGSCATAEAVLKYKKDVKYILVQLPEPCEEKTEAFKSGYMNIADIGKERIRRVSTKIKEENPGSTADLGFKVFKLDSSNILSWNPDKNNLEETLLDHTEHLVDGRSEEDMLYELLLKRGVDLTVPIEHKNIVGKTVYSIGYGVLLACLNETVDSDQVEELAQGIINWHKELEPATDTQVVFRDSAFADDIAKTNMTAILEQSGISHVRSL